ncbi:MAG: DNA polymerase III subunit alpha [Luteitalea sp.]|nr:DNA polymerase III subunit alpha [Luteitalea sp.]
MSGYIELHTASAFSFLEAASTPERLVERAAELGYPALALLDRDGVHGAPRFHGAAKAVGIRALIGAELTITGGAPSTRHPAPFLCRLPVLVESREGYRNLCRLITRMNLRAPKGEGALMLNDLDGHTAGLVALAGRAVCGAERYGVGGLLDRLIGVFGRRNVYVELQRHLRRDEEVDNQVLRALASAFRVPVVATNGVRFATPDERPLYDVLTCVRHKTTLAEAGTRLAVNAERYLKTPTQMAHLFADLPDALAASCALADRLQYTMADLGYRFPSYPVPPGETEASFLRKMTEAGARTRYRPFHERARHQLAHELAIIEKLDLAGYFLIVWDIVNFCRQHDILVQGRGSAANSAVCYSLGITAVDPVGMDLLFERFLSEERGEWPDIDLDLPSGDRRERAIQYVYERYGTHGAAMTANVITYRDRSAAREVGKALGMDSLLVDRLAKLMAHFEWRDPRDTLERHLRELGCAFDASTVRHFAHLWARIQDLPRHLGQHSGGLVICQGRLDEIVPLENAAMPGRVVVQWDKDDCAEMGLIKIDLLGLGMMAVLQEAIAIVNQGAEVQGAGVLDLANVPPDDPLVYEALQHADTIGLFQVESRAQMATLPRLKPRCFYDLVVEVAIIRPGPIVGRMVHPYLRRRSGLEPVTFPHASLEPILARTLGVPLFQEQLLRIAMVAAGFSGGEAEELRRAMGFKRSEARMRKLEVRLREGMVQRGIAGEDAEQILHAIMSFALYGFPESHAASFALLVYASAYLKVYYPAAFFTAMLNNQPLGFYHPATLVKDAQRHGVRFKPIDVQVSHWDCAVEEDGAIRLGLRYVQGLREEVGRKIEMHNAECRMQKDEVVFKSLEELVAATGIHHDELVTLASIGGLNSFGVDRRGALWEAARAIRPAGDLFDALTGESTDQPMLESLDDATTVTQSLALSRPMRSPLLPMTVHERTTADYEGTGLTIGPHPMMFRRTELAARGVLRAVDLSQQRNGRRVRVAGAVITRQRPGTAKGFVFLTLEDETGLANIIVRPGVFDSYRSVLLTEPFLLIAGILQQQEGVTSIRAERVVALSGSQPAVASHDFH